MEMDLADRSAVGLGLRRGDAVVNRFSVFLHLLRQL